MELFRVESGPRIAPLPHIQVTEEYEWFSATSGSDTRVAMAMCYLKGLVFVHRLRYNQLEKFAEIQLREPWTLLWLADRLLVADWDREKRSHAVIELEESDTRHERRRELIATSENIRVHRLCAVNDGFAIFDSNSKYILHYSFSRPMKRFLCRKFLRMKSFFTCSRAQVQNTSPEEMPLNLLTSVMQDSPAVHAVSICQVKYKEEQSTNGAIYAETTK